MAVHHRLEGPGDAPVLVLSPSLGTTHQMWDEQAAALSDHFQVLRYDMRGHGRSPVPPGPYAVADLGADVLALLDRLGFERASFCGLSIGGMIGIWLGVNSPQRIDRLVLCCTAPSLPPREQWIERARTVREQGIAPLADAAIERWFTPGFVARRPDVVERVRQMLLATPPEGYAGCCEAVADFDMRAELGAISAPTLVVAGAEDPVGTAEIARGLEEGIRDARLVIVPEARHLANVEQPAAVTGALSKHLGAEAPA